MQEDSIPFIKDLLTAKFEEKHSKFNQLWHEKNNHYSEQSSAIPFAD